MGKKEKQKQIINISDDELTFEMQKKKVVTEIGN